MTKTQEVKSTYWNISKYSSPFLQIAGHKNIQHSRKRFSFDTGSYLNICILYYDNLSFTFWYHPNCYHNILSNCIILHSKFWEDWRIRPWISHHYVKKKIFFPFCANFVFEHFTRICLDFHRCPNDKKIPNEFVATDVPVRRRGSRRSKKQNKVKMVETLQCENNSPRMGLTS